MKKQFLLSKVKQAKSTKTLTRKNAYDEKHQISTTKEHYEAANAYMEGKSYLERRLVWYQLSQGFRVVYHFLSVVLAMITAGLLTTGHLDVFNLNWLSACLLILTYLLLLLLFFALEWGKKEKASDVFYKLVGKDKVPTLQVIYLGMFVSASLVVSAIGGALIGDAQVNKTRKFEANKMLEVQRLEAGYRPRLAQLTAMIAGLENMATNPQLRRWGLTKEEQANLESSKAERDTLLAKKDRATHQINRKYTNTIQENNAYRIIGMSVGFGLVLCLELLLVYAYYFRSVFMYRVQTEGVQYEILPDPSDEEDVQADETVSNAALIKAIVNGFQASMMQMTQLLKDSSSSSGIASSTTSKEQRGEISLRPSTTRSQRDIADTADKSFTPKKANETDGLPLNKKKSQGDMADTADKPPQLKKADKTNGLPKSSGDMADTADKSPKSKKVNKTRTLPKGQGDMEDKTDKAGKTISRQRGYYIPAKCFERYFEGRDRDDEPYRKLRWYEAVIPDLQQGLKYKEILSKKYQVYEFQQQRYIEKRISETTLKATIVRGLKSLIDTTDIS